MPFTLAHAAAAVPLARLLGTRGVLSALVIGTMAPDFIYFLPLDLSRAHSHSLGGVFWFCVPAGLLGYWLWHHILTKPLLALTPPGWRSRLLPLSVTRQHRRSDVFIPLLVSLALGAISHIAWDAFTHAGAPAVVALPLLQAQLWHIAGYPLQVYKVLQHGSTVVGCMLLGYWLWRWFQQQPVISSSAPHGLSSRLRVLTLASMGGTTVAFMLGTGALRLPAVLHPGAVSQIAGRLAIDGLSGLVLALLGFSVLWHASTDWRKSVSHSQFGRRR